MFLFSKKIKLPQTLKAYDDLIDKVVKKYNLTDKRHASAHISIAIRRLPNEQAYTTYKYLGNYVLKNIANYVANNKSNELEHEAQITALTATLTTDPNDMEARDALEKASNEGSILAKAALEKINTAESVTHLNVVPDEVQKAST